MSQNKLFISLQNVVFQLPLIFFLTRVLWVESRCKLVTPKMNLHFKSSNFQKSSSSNFSLVKARLIFTLLRHVFSVRFSSKWLKIFAQAFGLLNFGAWYFLLRFGSCLENLSLLFSQTMETWFLNFLRVFLPSLRLHFRLKCP